ncbi:MAG: NYN domain-containing protein [Rhodothermaceae bacterium]|nr:NYN domain-containing protein [Rhodothermaceae bacterium]
MRKRRLIDAHNVMHKIGAIASRLPENHSDAYSHFVTIVSQICLHDGIGATLVFDGPKTDLNRSGGNITIQFSHPHSADDRIRSTIRQKGARGKWIVITDDQEILDDCRFAGVATQRSSEFIRLMQADQGKHRTENLAHDPGENPEAKVNAAEVDEMLRLFNEGRDEA